MDLILLYLCLSMWLLCWMYTTTGSTQANTSTLRTLAFSGLLSLGVVCVLLCTTLLAAKIFWLGMIEALDQTLLNFLIEVLRSKSSVLTVI